MYGTRKCKAEKSESVMCKESVMCSVRLNLIYGKELQQSLHLLH